MADASKTPSSWVYPDRDAWEELLNIRPRPRSVMDKPEWWHKPWPARWPGKPAGAALSDDRKLKALRRELAWAQRCFHYAEHVLPDSQTKEKAGRIADALGRARRAIDAPEKAADVAQAVDELAGVGRYDPSRNPRAFVDTAGRSISATGRALAASRFESVAYWGRVFGRAGGFFRSMRHQLLGEG